MRTICFLSVICLCLLPAAKSSGEGRSSGTESFRFGQTLAAEESRLRSARDSFEKTDLYLSFASSRLSEVRDLIPQGQEELVDERLKHYSNSLRDLLTEIGRVRSQGLSSYDYLVSIESSLKEQADTLSTLQESAAPEFRGSLRQALLAAQNTANTIRDWVDRQDSRGTGLMGGGAR